MDHYETLGVSPQASTDEIKRACRTLVKRYHPDLNAAPDAQEMTCRLNQAFEVLSDPAERRFYDATLAGQRPRGASASIWEDFIDDLAVDEDEDEAFDYDDDDDCWDLDDDEDYDFDLDDDEDEGVGYGGSRPGWYYNAGEERTADAARAGWQSGDADSAGETPTTGEILTSVLFLAWLAYMIARVIGYTT